MIVLLVLYNNVVLWRDVYWFRVYNIVYNIWCIYNWNWCNASLSVYIFSSLSSVSPRVCIL